VGRKPPIFLRAPQFLPILCTRPSNSDVNSLASLKDQLLDCVLTVPTMTPTTLLIDLDDTLFEERDYVASGFWAVARHLPIVAPDVAWGDTALLQSEMMATLDREGRGAVFDRLFNARGATPAPGLISRLVSHYRQHQPNISPYAGAVETLESLAATYRLALVTNGNLLMQQCKVAALNIGHVFEAVIYCDEEAAPKPDPAGLFAALKALGEPVHRAVMIGDNPSTDGMAAAAALIPFLRVRSPRFAHLPAEVPEVTSFSQVPEVLAAGFSI